MRLHILLNALSSHDAVSTHCLLLRQRAAELGVAASIYAQFSDQECQRYVEDPALLNACASPGDILLHQFYNETAFTPIVEQFPGYRLLMYHNITPPRYFPHHDEAWRTCSRGLRLVAAIPELYDLAVGLSEFSCRNLQAMGYSRTEVFPLFLDLDALHAAATADEPAGDRWPREDQILFVGRVAPNKRIEDLLSFIARYRASVPGARLIVVGNSNQHPWYTKELERLAAKLKLTAGDDYFFTGQVSRAALASWYRSSDAFVCLSEHEGFCAPLIESMSFGLPTFAAPHGACPDTMGGAGVLLGNEESEDIVQTVRSVLGDRPLREAVIEGQNQRTLMFSADSQRRHLRALIDSLTSVPPPPRRRHSVSVVINTYNRAALLERCVNALRVQTFLDFEIVVVNGPSTDDTEHRMARLKDEVRMVTTTSRVLSVSRNVGIRSSRGDLVAFIDDDAVAQPDWLENLVPAFQCSAVGGAGGLVYKLSGRDIEFRNGRLDRRAAVCWNEEWPGLDWHWEEGRLNTVSGNNCIFRRSSLEAIGGFDERIEYYHDEADVVMRLERAGSITVHRPAAIVFHEAASGHNRRSRYHVNWYAVVKNTFYCALKNFSGAGSRLHLVPAIARFILAERMEPMIRWRRSGEISTADFLRMEGACLRGAVVGIRRGIRHNGQVRPLPAGVSSTIGRTSRGVTTFSVCLLTRNLPQDSPGGVATYTITLARALRDLGCSVHVVSAGATVVSRFEDGIWHHTVVPIPVASDLGLPMGATGRNLDYSEGVRRCVNGILARWGLDIVESPSWDSEGLLVAMERRVPMVVRLHSPMFKVMDTQAWPATPDLQLCSDVEGLLIRHADGISGSTRALLSMVDQRFALPRGRTALIPLGLDVPGAHPVPPSEVGRRVLFAGRLERRKGIDILLDAIPAVLHAIPDTYFDIVGRDTGEGAGPCWEQTWRERYPWARDRVEFHGEVSQEDLGRHYAQCDLMVAPSRFESFGLVFVEAMAFGKPVIGTLSGGVPEVVADGETGLLVPPDDAGALSAAIIRMLSDKELRARMANAAWNRYHDLFSAGALGRRTLDWYRRIAAARSGAGVVWHGTVVDAVKAPGTQVVWNPELRRLCAVAPANTASTFWYGPYVGFAPGLYRVEFRIYVGEWPLATRGVGSVDVFSMRSSLRIEKILSADDFQAGPGLIVDLFFEVDSGSASDFEFRIHSEGVATLCAHEVVVSRWPLPVRALPSDDRVDAESQLWNDMTKAADLDLRQA
jgi:glycosyltransferase involved in cell wall biosynthesis/GT2 family glycosyltransferase